MSQPTTAHAWFRGGPADGAVRQVECRPGQCPPQLLIVRGGRLYIGSADEPTPRSYAMYALEPTPASPGMWPYRHIATIDD